jgi:hypothetical protein
MIVLDRHAERFGAPEGPIDVRFGSKAEVKPFTSMSAFPESGHPSRKRACRR